VLLFLTGHFPARIITPLLTSFLHVNVAPEADFYLFGVFAIICALWLVWVCLLWFFVHHATALACGMRKSVK
jgi:hypothetical protein